MTVIYISDFDLRGSGYANIAVSLCTELTTSGYKVIALGLGYNGQEHYHPFTIVQVGGVQEIAPMLRQFKATKLDIEAVVVALDIPLQEMLLRQLNTPSEWPYIGLFPLEAGPLCSPWAMSLLRMDERLIMSRFGQAELEAVGVESEFIPIAFDPQSWRPPTPEERILLRQGLGVEEGQTIILTVADNQERKNLSRSMEIFADFAHRTPGAVYWLVTRPHSPVGWKLEDYALQLGIMDRVQIWERGMPFKQLWSLYAAADMFLLTSKAEGLAMPVLEAMSCRLPVAGTNCAAISEHLNDGRGLLISSDYVMIDPWGNSRRYLASRDDGLYKLQLWFTGMSVNDQIEMLNRAQAYANGRTWAQAGKVLIEAIERTKARRSPGVVGEIINMAELSPAEVLV
jgi:glycosyltransferase involved in cell wall biosynthesis